MEPPPTFSPARRWTSAAHVGLSIAALVAIVAMTNFLASRHFKTFSWAAENRLTLSPMTRHLVESLTNKVQIAVLYDRRDSLYSSVSELLRQYEAASPNIDLEFVDYLYNPSRAEQIQAQFKLAPETGNRIIFHCDNRGTKVVREAELSIYDLKNFRLGHDIKRTAFRGEPLFTSAIYSVIDPSPVTAYFLEGHGESDPGDGNSQEGFLKFARLLRDNNIQVQALSLLTNDVPSDCELLVVAAPRHALPASELAAIQRYLQQGGRIFALFAWNARDLSTGLEQLFANWGIEVGHNVVVDDLQAKSGEQGVLLVNHFGEHPIVASLGRSRLWMALPRSIAQRSTAASADAVKVVELATSGPRGAAVATRNKDQGVVVRDGAIPLIVAAEKGSIQGVSADRGITRLLVAGDSLFLGNVGIDLESNRDFATLAINWLLNREVLLEGIGPRPIREYRLNLTDSEMRNIRWLMLAILPGAVMLAGLLVWARRRV